MATTLEVHGPCTVEFKRNGKSKNISSEQVKRFKRHHADILKKQGIYVFCKKAGKGYTPWYVGKAGKNFGQEIFTPSKLNYYNKVLFEKGFGTPAFFFVAPPGKKKKISTSTLKAMEKLLIECAYAKNEDICNKHHANIPRWSICGVINSQQGQPSKAAVGFRNMMGIG